MGNKIDSSLSSQTYALTFETLSATNPEHCIALALHRPNRNLAPYWEEMF